MKDYFSPAYVLHRRSYRETSLLLDVFSRDEGRISLIAKGAKRKNSGRAALLQPCQRLRLTWTGNTEMMTLTGVEVDSPAGTISQKRLIAAFYLNELVVRLLHRHEAHADLFNAYDETLIALADDSSSEQACIRKFEKQLLQAIGYGPIFDHDVNTGEAVDPEQQYYYQADRGPVLTKPDHSDFVMVDGDALLAILQDSLATEKIRRQAKKLMRYLLQRHLGEKPLASRNLYRSYMNLP